MKIIVLAGGISPERNVSLISGIQIASALINKGHQVMLLDLWKGIHSEDFPAVYQTTNKNWNKKIDILKTPLLNEKSIIGEGIIPLCQEADKVFLALHGSIGENGNLQSILETNHINFTGTKSVGSMLAMDKAISKRMLQAYQILTPTFLESRDPEFDTDKINLPCVVKPCSCGSSVGISIAETKSDLENAIKNAKKFENNFIVEEKINGREFSVGILNGEVLPPIEIIVKEGFYDYDNKYNGNTKEVCPAIINEELLNKLQESAKKVHHALRLGAYSRIDFIVDSENNCYCLEANTLPGMTPMSLFPQEAKAMNITFEELCDRIIKSESKD